MCTGGIDLRHLQRETESRLAGFPKMTVAGKVQPGVFAQLAARLRKRVGLILVGIAGLFLAGCMADDTNRFPPEDHDLIFTFNWAPAGTVCDAMAVGKVEKKRDILGAPRVKITGFAQTSVITCTLPDGTRFVGAFAASLPFGSMRAFEASAVYSRRDDRLPVDVRSGNLGTIVGNGMVRIP